ncbi:MAG: DNA polymerase I, partial [Propionibacteriaceae bacterium]|nr:DNA polymerase I [Propionibacteriaceae bacterium]
IVHLQMANYEADDIIATLATRAVRDGLKVLIATGDRDSFQLVNQDVTVLYPIRGVSELARLDPAAVEAKYLVAPQRYPELAALVGESSDNLPGVPGVGPKTAAKWLKAYDGLDNLLNHADEVSGKVGESLRAHLGDVRRNRRLNALLRDLDTGVAVADLRRRPFDRQAVHEVFDTLEFRTLRNRVLETQTADDGAVAGGYELSATLVEPGGLRAWLDANATGTIGLEVAGTWGQGAGDVESLALANDSGQACWFDVSALLPDDEAALGEWLADESRPKVLHDPRGPLLALWSRGWELRGLIGSTLLAAYLLRPDQRTFDFADLVVRYLKRDLKGQAQPADQGAFDFDQSGGDDAMERARAVIELARALEAELAERGGAQLLREVELPLAFALGRMERAGVAVDGDVLDGLRADFDQVVSQAEAAAHEALGHPVNLGSPKQLQAVLFEELGMPKTRRTLTGYTTDAEALRDLYERRPHPFLAHVLEYRDSIKLRQTVDGLLKAVADDGRVHTTYLQTAAATGRLSSADPNLQNIPVRTPAGRRIRDAFVVGNGFETLLTADYSQIEMRIMAHVSGDAGLIEAFGSGADFHTMMASRVFGVPAEAVSGGQRAKIKAMNYGLAYGLSAFGLSQQLGVPQAEAKVLMDEYFARFGHVRDYLNDVVEQARRTGYTETILGRRRYLPDLNSTNRQRRQMAERAALNAPIQGSAADIIKIAMLDVESALASQGLASRMLLQVHDELVFEVAAGEVEAVRALAADKMGHAVDLAVPLEVSIGVGRTWNDAAH